MDNYDMIVVKDLKITNMVRNHNLAQKILDALSALVAWRSMRAG